MPVAAANHLEQDVHLGLHVGVDRLGVAHQASILARAGAKVETGRREVSSGA
jgi:hypothetical protein